MKPFIQLALWNGTFPVTRNLDSFLLTWLIEYKFTVLKQSPLGISGVSEVHSII